MAIKLADKKCIPCQGGVKPFSKDKIKKYLPKLEKSWQVVDNKKIRLDLTLKNFMQAVDFVNKVAKIAEAEDHHPDICITGYKNVRVDIYTHKIDGLWESDFILAAKIEQLI